MVFENVDELADDIRVLFKNGDGERNLIALRIIVDKVILLVFLKVSDIIFLSFYSCCNSLAFYQLN